MSLPSSDIERNAFGLAGPSGMPNAAHDGLVYIEIAIPDLKVKSAIGIGADPGFIVDRRPLAAEI